MSLIKLDDSDLTVTDPAEDIRGRTVLDVNGDEIGRVRSLVIDEEEKKVRFLEVESGGFLGIGSETRLLPVDAIASIDDTHVHVDQTREHVHRSTPYDPDLGRDYESYYEGLYGYYGYPPYWAGGYTYPPYPYYR